MSGTPIAKMWAELGFKVNDSGLKDFEGQLNRASQQIRRVANEITSSDRVSAKASENRRKHIDGEIAEAKRLQRQYRKTHKTLRELTREKRDVEFLIKKTDKPAARDIHRDTLRRITQEIDTERKRLDGIREQQAKAQYQKKRERVLPKWEARLQERKAQADEQKRIRDQMEKAGMLAYEERERKRREEAKKTTDEAKRAERERAQKQRTEESRNHQRKMHDLRSEEREKDRQHRAELARLRAEYSARKRNNWLTYKGSREYARAFFPGIGTAFALQQSTQNYQSYVGMEQGLTAATGSKETGAQELKYLLSLSKELGVYVGDMARNYSRFAASTKDTSITLDKQRHIFKSVAAMGRVLNMSADEMNSSFRAISQMASKGKVTSEELRLQLAERMPGAIQAMARAAQKAGIITGNTPEELTAALEDAMKAGKVYSSQVLPYFADELWEVANAGGALTDAVKTSSAEIARFKTSALEANKIFNVAGYDKGVGRWFGELNEALEKAEPLWILLGKAADQVGWALQTPVELFGTLAEKLEHFTEESEEGEARLRVLAGTLLLVSKRARMVFALFWVLPAVISALNDTIENGWQGWDDLAVKIGLVASAALTLAGPLGRIKRAVGAITGTRRGGLPSTIAHPRNQTASVGVGSAIATSAMVPGPLPVKLGVAVATAGALIFGDEVVKFFENLDTWFSGALQRYHDTGVSIFEQIFQQADDRVRANHEGIEVPDGGLIELARQQNPESIVGERISNFFGGIYDKLRMADIAYRREHNLLSYDPATVEQTLIARPDIATPNISVGDVNITVDGSGDPEATGLAVEERFMSLFNNQMRLSSMADPVMEQ